MNSHFRTLLFILLLLVLSVAIPFIPNAESATMDCKHFLIGWDAQCLVQGLRTDFNISTIDISDQDLVNYVSQNEEAMATLLLQIDYGNNVVLFMNGGTNNLDEKNFVDILSDANTDNILDRLSDIADIYSNWNMSIMAGIAADSLSALSTVVSGIEAYETGAEVLSVEPARELFNIYFPQRYANTASTTAWQDLTTNFSEPLTLLSNLKNISMNNLGGGLKMHMKRIV